MNRIVAFLYGLVSYAIFFGVFLYLLGFLANALVPKSIDSGVAGPWPLALAVNVGLILLFGLQHSVMARPTFKRWWTRFVPKPIERATYVMATNLCLIALYVLWQPMPTIIWEFTHPAARIAWWSLFGAGWMLVFVSTWLIHHFELFGLRQVWNHLLRREEAPVAFKTPLFYKVVRHPLYLGWMLAFWATPTMTVGHLLFAVSTTAYMLIAIRFEERNLIDAHGEAYVEYRKRTPMLLPRPRRAPSPVASAPTASTPAGAVS